MEVVGLVADSTFEVPTEGGLMVGVSKVEEPLNCLETGGVEYTDGSVGAVVGTVAWVANFAVVVELCYQG